MDIVNTHQIYLIQEIWYHPPPPFFLTRIWHNVLLKIVFDMAHKWFFFLKHMQNVAISNQWNNW